MKCDGSTHWDGLIWRYHKRKITLQISGWEDATFN